MAAGACANPAERPSPQLAEVSSALDGLGVAHQARIFNTYPIDVYISHQVTNGTAFGILLHPKDHYTSARCF